MAPLIYGIGTHDPLTFVLVPVTLLAIALAASSIPMLRAGHIEPIEVLRQD